ncbi:MAG: hypothetical protein H7644_12450, partial [Candidatus Heimdallarchaeota archaeon]|nr:hypothetical protein [Candidatus Heimdallarchaeota archaeon]MCK5144570.1 hypothetical protein [Candidatus Heimdallarchaeota archaeon]
MDYRKSAIVLGIILFWLGVYSPEIYHNFFLLDSLKNKENAVIVIIGKRYPLELGHVVDENHQIFKELYRDFWYNLTSTLANYLGWQFHFFYEDEYQSEKMKYNQVLVLLEGMGFYSEEERKQYFSLSSGIQPSVNELLSPILSANLTLISSTSFFKNDWRTEIETIGEQTVYTSSLSEKLEFLYFSLLAYSNETLVYLDIVSYGSCYISKLVEGYSFAEVNETLWNYM